MSAEVKKNVPAQAAAALDDILVVEEAYQNVIQGDTVRFSDSAETLLTKEHFQQSYVAYRCY